MEIDQNQIVDDDTTTDRVSDLPEFIIHHILSYLDSPKDLVRTSVLSKNWFYLTASFPVLDFNFRKFNETHVDIRRPFFKYVEYTTSRFCKQNVSVHTLNLVTPLLENRVELDIVNRCLGAVLAKGVKVLEINPNVWVHSPQMLRMRNSPEIFRLPNVLLSASSLTSLKICNCELPSSLMVDDVKFKSLKVLQIEGVALNEKVTTRLTSSCSLLEELIVEYCYGFKTFCVSGLQNLQKLRINLNGEVERIDIDAPNMFDLFLIVMTRKPTPSVNVALCKKLTTLSYCGYPSLTSNDFTRFFSNFPFLETLFWVLPREYNKLKLSSHSLKTFVLNSKCSLDDIDIDTPNLLSFDYKGLSPGPLVRNGPLLKTRMGCYPLDAVDGHWFQKLRLFLDKINRFKELRLFVSAFSDLIEDVEALKVIQSAPYELEHVEVEPCIIEEVPVYLAVVEAILWCCRPQSLTLESNFPCTTFEEWSHVVKTTYEKLLQQEDEGITKIQIVLSSSSKVKKCFSDLNSLLTAVPCDQQGATITFIKEEVVQEEADDQTVKRLRNMEIS